MAQAPRDHGPHNLPLVTLAILEDALKIFSMCEPCRSPLHFSSSNSLEAPQQEQVWLAGGNTISDTIGQDKGSASWRPPAPALGVPWFHRPGLPSGIWTSYPNALPLKPPLRTAQMDALPASSCHPRGHLSPFEGLPTAFPSGLISGQFCHILGICELTLSHWGPSVPSTCPQ